MIPKKLHFIWLGRHECPLDIEKVKSLYDDYEIKIWRDNDVAELMETSKMKDLFYATQDKYMAKSDIARIEILHRFGGIYMDCDIVFVKKLEDFYLDRKSFGFYENEFLACGQLSNGIIGSEPNSRFTNIYIDVVTKYNLEKVKKLVYWDTFKYTGPYLLTYIYMKYELWEFDVFPSRFVWPINVLNVDYKAEPVYSYEPYNLEKYEKFHDPHAYSIDPDYKTWDITELIKDLLKKD